MTYEVGEIAVEYVSHTGDDLTVVNAARVSLDKESAYDPSGALQARDLGLLRFLARNDHWSPFAHPQITLRMTAPIFVARQLMRHEQGLHINEMSRRYTEGNVELFVPDEWRQRAETRTGLVRKPVGLTAQVFADGIVLSAYEEAVDAYENLLKAGVAPEQARMILPQAAITRWYWTGSLAAFARVYRQRTVPAAQEETATAAEQIAEVVEPLFPESWPLLVGKSVDSGDKPA